MARAAVSTTDPNAMAGRYALPPTPVTVEFQVAGREKQIYAWEGVLNRYEGSGIDPQSRTSSVLVSASTSLINIRLNGEDPKWQIVSSGPAGAWCVACLSCKSKGSTHALSRA
jgi:hypothetical protein